MNLLAGNTFLVLATFAITCKISLWFLYSFIYVLSDQWVPLLRLWCWCAVCSHLLHSHCCPQLHFEHYVHPYQDPSSLFLLIYLSKGNLVCLGWLMLINVNSTSNATFPYLSSLPEKKFALFACSQGDARFAESSICEFACWKCLYSTMIKTVTELFYIGKIFKMFTSLNQVVSDLTVFGKTLYHIKEPFWKASSKKEWLATQFDYHEFSWGLGWLEPPEWKTETTLKSNQISVRLAHSSPSVIHS